MRTLDPTEPVLSGDHVLLRIGLRVTVTEVKDDGRLVVEHRPGEEADIPLRDVWKLINRPERAARREDAMTDHRDPLPLSTQDDRVRTTDAVVQTAAQTVHTQQEVRTLDDTIDTPDDTPPPAGEKTALVPPDAIPQ